VLDLFTQLYMEKKAYEKLRREKDKT